MAEKKDIEKGTDDKPIPVKLVGAAESASIPVVRSDTEQSIIDSLGDDPSKYKEGTRERDLVEGLPENIAKKKKEGKTEQAKEGELPSEAEGNLDDYTVAELKEMAAKKGIGVSWDANKADIIKAIKKGK
jgi:hypothetical protein